MQLEHNASSSGSLQDCKYQSQWQMDTTNLQYKAAEFLTNGLALNTRTTYTAGQQRFADFCQEISVTTMPASEELLILFATHLAASNIAHTIIKVYISATRQWKDLT